MSSFDEHRVSGSATGRPVTLREKDRIMSFSTKTEGTNLPVSVGFAI